MQVSPKNPGMNLQGWGKRGTLIFPGGMEISCKASQHKTSSFCFFWKQRQNPNRVWAESQQWQTTWGRETEASASACRLMTNCQGENQPHVNPVNCISLGFGPGGKGRIPEKSCSVCKQVFVSPESWHDFIFLSLLLLPKPLRWWLAHPWEHSRPGFEILKMSLLIAGAWIRPLRVPSNPILWF